MPPNLLGSSALLLAEAAQISPVPSTSKSASQPALQKQRNQYEWQIVWRNVIAFIYLHSAAVYGLYLVLFGFPKFYTYLWTTALIYLSGMGITAGAHRLWAHKAYKATWQLQTILMVLQTLAFQNHIYEWVRDHRVHHKFTDTDADPHNSRRGFFFSHMGWLMVRKHKDVMTKGGTVDMSDLEKDPIVSFQRKFYLLLLPIFCFFVPTWVPWYCWGENGWVAWYVAAMFRYCSCLNGTWMINSGAHIWGMKPYDRNISSTDNPRIASFSFGEGWHNYHHVFPWDYKAAELGTYGRNFTTAFIDFFARVGWAYDLKTVPLRMIQKRAQRTGDGSRSKIVPEEPQDHVHEDQIWGWGDKDMKAEDIEDAEIINKSKQ